MTDYAAAHLRQARSDLAVFDLLAGQDGVALPACHALHHLQMATEKLAKATMDELRFSGFDRHSHVAFSILPYALRRREVGRRLGFPNFDAYRTLLDRLRPLFREVEQLHPSIEPPAGNVEYPWRGRDSTGRVAWRVPADQEFGLLSRFRHDTDAATLLHLVRLIAVRFDGAIKP